MTRSYFSKSVTTDRFSQRIIQFTLRIEKSLNNFAVPCYVLSKLIEHENFILENVVLVFKMLIYASIKRELTEINIQ